MDSATTGPRPNAATPAPQAPQRPPPPPSQQVMRRHRQGQHAVPDAAQKVGAPKRKLSASPAAKDAPPLYDLPPAATVFNNGLDVSMEEVGVDLFGQGKALTCFPFNFVNEIEIIWSLSCSCSCMDQPVCLFRPILFMNVLVQNTCWSFQIYIADNIELSDIKQII